MQSQDLDKNHHLTVAFTSPGWPLSKFHNGIVTYVHNILHGFDDKTKAIVLAGPLVGDEVEQKFINVSKFLTTKNVLQRLVDRILAQLNLPFVKSIQYRRAVVTNAKKINIALKSLNCPLDILEMEESFGTAHFLLKMTKTPIVSRIHGPWFTMGDIMRVSNDWDFKLRLFYEGEAIKNSHGVTAPSLDVLEKVREHYGIALPHAQVIPNPVGVVSIEKRWQDNPNNASFILMVGRFDLHKGGDLALQAFRLIAQKNKDIQLLFVGPDRGVNIEGKNVQFNEYIERFISEESVKTRIQFLGSCDHDRISDLRKNALVTIFCSRYENFPLSLLEALSTGCPTVATAVGGVKEIIVNDYNGLLAEPESPESIAEAVLTLIDDPEKMQFLSKNAIEDCKKRFSPEVVAAQTVDYYKSVLTRVSNIST